MSLHAHALVIGVSQYRHIRPLPRVADAEDLAGILRDPAACGYDPANVVLLQDEQATRAAIVEGLERLGQRAGPGSTALVYFSGHGGRLPGSRDSYLMPVDGAWGAEDRLDATAISSQLLGDGLAAIRAERLTVILDCCHAADLAAAKDLEPPVWVAELTESALGRLARRGRVVMAASRGDGSAYVIPGARYGLFTEHLIAGLRGAAGGDDGFVRVFDLYHHVQRNVVARNPAQRPVLKAEAEDNYPIARSQRAARPTSPAVAQRFAYDVLLVYSPDQRDAAWARSLLRLLEDRGVRVCTEQLDAELGAMRVSEIERLVSSSRYTVPVLTPRFSLGGFQELQTQMALHLGVEDGRARLIPIVRESYEARLALRFLVSLDMTRDDSVVPGVERLVRTLRKAQAAPAR
ncbi:MAG: TIR domain-containing protein [Deltaproteobacteria bacterium]|nr:MAG: TIR domain-containing protein [Deltaproteobacteria bacterium]TMQ24580.1 MAG: TIR domain-containing protein [Deltaproteobacteria bacterium]